MESEFGDLETFSNLLCRLCHSVHVERSRPATCNSILMIFFVSEKAITHMQRKKNTLSFSLNFLLVLDSPMKH